MLKAGGDTVCDKISVIKSLVLNHLVALE